MIVNHQQNQLVKIRSQSGFTLIELSISMIIVGLMVAGFIQAYTIYDAKRKIEIADLRMTDVNQAIADFVAREGRLPCPAPMGGRAADGSIRFNEEDCSTANGNLRVTGTDGNMVLIGKYPAAALDTSNDYMRDVYGNYLIYAVTESATNAATFAGTSGAIIVEEKGVEDDPGAPNFGDVGLLSTHNNVEYVIVSMGNNGFGRYAYDGSQDEVCDDSINDEHENCDGDATFKVSAQSDQFDTDLYYDDQAFFESNVADLLPTEPSFCEQHDTITVTADECPENWEKIDNSIMPFTPQLKKGNSRRDTFNVETPNGPNLGQNSFYNIDPDTNEYYISNIRTDKTVNNIKYDSNKKTTCKKAAGNTVKNKCFTDQIEIPYKQYVPGKRAKTTYNHPKSENPKDYCPEGYRAIGYLDGPQWTVKWETGGEGQEDQYRDTARVTTVHCVR